MHFSHRGILFEKMISAQSFPEFLASNIPTDRPSFTTPSLDFATHSVELQRHLEQIYYLRDSYFDLFPIREKDVHLVESRKNERILKAIERVLERLNLLTKPPKKKKKSCKKEMKGSSDNSSSESLSEDSKAGKYRARLMMKGLGRGLDGTAGKTRGQLLLWWLHLNINLMTVNNVRRFLRHIFCLKFGLEALSDHYPPFYDLQRY